MIKKALIFILCSTSFFSCNKTDNKNIEYLYLDNGEKYKTFEHHQNGDITVEYFLKDGTKEAQGYKVGDIETITFFDSEGRIYQEGQFKNGKKMGWHTFYDEKGKTMNEIFFVDDKVNQGKTYNKNDDSIDIENSLYVEFHMPIDTLPQNEEVPAYLKYINGKSKYEFIRVYLNLNNEVKSDFSNIYNVAVDTFGAEPKEQDIYFLVKFPNKGKNYIRGYLVDAVSDSVSDQSKGINIFFEHEVYVR